METEERSVVDLLLKGDLEAVTQGLEDGLYSWEELDQPYNTQGSTPLISACQMGLDLAMRFLLERGADATLCDHSNQTALHVSHPDLQKELLAAMLRPLTHRAQLLEVAWRGDICTLQRLLSETNSVDLNIQNQNGLTPLMLAVRDVDLFEGFQGTMGWNYDPIEVVKTLLDQSANVDIRDQKSYTVLTYVSQIKSAIKHELFRIILKHQTRSEEPTKEMLESHFPVKHDHNSQSISSPVMFSTLANVRDPLPVPCLRTPKHLAPLDQEYQEGRMLSNFQCPSTPKLSSLLSFGSKEKRESFFRLSSRGSKGKGRGSEESSYSSQSSLDEEGPQETGQMFGNFEREPYTALLPALSVQLINSGITEHVTSNSPKPPFMRHQKLEAQMMHNSKTLRNLDSCETNGVEIIGSLANELETNETVPEGKPAPEDGSFVPTEPRISPVNITLHPNKAETSKARKTTRAGKIQCKPPHTAQTFNILDRTNARRHFAKKSRRKQLSQVRIEDSCLIENITGENNEADLTNMAPLKPRPKLKDAPLKHKRTPESMQEGRLCGAKKISNKPQSQGQLVNRDTRKTSKQAKRPGISGPQRTKSSLDHVSYRDMFLEIHHSDEGPAIFEMFATPLYENLRAGSSVDRPKLVYSAPQVKRQLSGQHRAPKPAENNRRRHDRKKGTISKGKHRKRKEVPPTDPQSHDSRQNSAREILGSEGNNPKRKHQLLTTKDDQRHELDLLAQTEHSPILSMIREVTLETLKNISFHNQPGGLSSSFQSHRGPNHSMQLLQLKTDEHINERHELFSSETEDSDAVQLSSQPLINTWTGNRTKSPVYRFFDEVGEGPVTDDLLRRLAEELISLEEKEGEPKNPEWTNDPPEKFKVTPLNNLLRTEKSSVDDTITWTKGEILGRGAYGTVYCGLSSEGQLIAVKQVTLDVSNSETAEKEYDRLEREVDLLKNLNHQNIVGFLGTTLSGNVISILMEYVPGGSISNVLNRFGPLPEKVFALYTRQILEGVVYLHDNRVIHRDLKGNNIMLMPSGIIKLIDFGCARRLNCLTHSGSRSDFLTSVHGTPYWMAPEVINESGHGKKSDIWSIGCTVFEMATGKPPLAHMGKMAALFYIGAKKGLMPSLPDVFSEDAKGFVQECLINDQKQRPSAADLLQHPFVFYLRQSTTNKSSILHQ
ncbi:mitogen-activated protein kinase kinase kinase 19 [Silurus meridionalis]|nr:mitogen-activated protein kinase kinase kinase 19 [Silurus meridionalis]